jgi:arylsulfatase A-like enzyme
MKELWGDVEWGVISGKQRHYLQVQHVDQLLNNLLDHLQSQGMLDESMVIVAADHGISFALNDTRRALSDINKAALLRVPLFIKLPGQNQGQRINRPAMTIDILPTMLAALGFSGDSLELDGIDLSAAASNQPRQRQANSHLNRELKKLDEAELDVSELVAETRRQLKLDDPARALWEIGPYDEFRGHAMESVCERRYQGQL